MHTGLFDMLHNAANNRGAAVADGIHIKFKSILYNVITSYSIHYTKLYDVAVGVGGGVGERDLVDPAAVGAVLGARRPEQIEEEKIIGQKDTDNRSFQQQQSAVEDRHPFVHRAPGDQHAEKSEQTGEQQQKQTDAVNPQLV